MSETAMISGRTGHVVNCGIPYKLKIRDNTLVFFEDGMLRCRVMTLYKNRPYELIYVELHRQDTPACHVERARQIAEHFIGPDHFESLGAMRRFESHNAWKNAFGRTYIGWRFGWRASCLWRAFWHWWKLRHPDTLKIRWESPGEDAEA